MNLETENLKSTISKLIKPQEKKIKKLDNSKIDRQIGDITIRISIN